MHPIIIGVLLCGGEGGFNVWGYGDILALFYFYEEIFVAVVQLGLAYSLQ